MSETAETWAPVVEVPAPTEAVRNLEQHPDVKGAGFVRDSEGVSVDAVLVERVDAVPVGVARILYRRGLSISDVSPAAGRKHTVVTATTEGRA